MAARRVKPLRGVYASRHAVERFVERIRPDLPWREPDEFVRAQTELLAWMQDAKWGEDWPAWLAGRLEPQRHLRVGDACLPLRRVGQRSWVVTTILTREHELERVTV
jgi:hypothetical protein